MRQESSPSLAPLRPPLSPLEPEEIARVLLVDDDPLLLRVLAETLDVRLAPIIVHTCGSGVEALELIKRVDYDVVVSDFLMSGLSGLELLHELRVLRPESLVVLVTGATDRDISVRALRGGAYDFIVKPVDGDYLCASLRRAVETRRLRTAVTRQSEELRRHADELERTVELRTEELRQANRAKDEFLATVSHELRTPLTAILGWARMLDGGRLTPDLRVQAVESITKNARAQAQLIDDLLDVSRIVTGMLRIEHVEVDLASVLSDATDVILPTAQAKGVAVRREIAQREARLIGDPDRLRQVFWNLLSNAVRFTPAGGLVLIRERLLEDAVEVDVEDDGCGIDPNLLPHVFERFRQGDGHHASRRGLGLGLAIARHLIELHGGAVAADSGGTGKGACFTVRLPCERSERPSPIPRRPARTSVQAPLSCCLRGVRILLVDDEPDTREVLRLMLQQAGALVTPASSYAEALRAFEAAPPEVLLCDIDLGGEDGCLLLEEILAIARPRELAFHAIALTAYAGTEDRLRATKAGFELHLAKPGPPDLPRIVASLIGREES